MHEVLSVVYVVLLCAGLAGGILMVPFTLPGTWVIAAAAFLYSLVGDFHAKADWILVVALLVLAVVGEVIEFVTGTLGAKKKDVSNGAVVSSVVGGLIGAIIGVPVFLIGAFLGLLLGTYLGGLIYSLVKDKNVREALKDAWAVLTSRVVAIFAKTGLAVFMAAVVLFYTFV